jgi:hypothetical protein
MIIETLLADLWKEYVNSLEGRAKKDKDTLLRVVRSWTSYHHIEMFAALGRLDEITVRLFHQMRRKRNNITHKREEVKEREAVGCLSAARRTVVNRVRNQSPFLDLEKNDLIEFWNLKDKNYEKPASEG